MIRGFGVAFALFLGVTAVGAAVIWLSTRDSSVLAQGVLNQAQSALSSAATASATDTSGVATETGEVLDSTESVGMSEAPVSEQIETYRIQARSDLIRWFSLTMVGGLLATFLWLAFAHRRSRNVHGPQGARSAGGLWWGGFLFCGIAGGLVALYMLRSQGLGAIVSAAMINVGFLLCFLLVALAYYLATALGAPAVMRPSVPVATLIFR
jgi:hypothetical protein